MSPCKLGRPPRCGPPPAARPPRRRLRPPASQLRALAVGRPPPPPPTLAVGRPPPPPPTLARGSNRERVRVYHENLVLPRSRSRPPPPTAGPPPGDARNAGITRANHDHLGNVRVSTTNFSSPATLTFAAAAPNPPHRRRVSAGPPQLRPKCEVWSPPARGSTACAAMLDRVRRQARPRAPPCATAVRLRARPQCASVQRASSSGC
jgi:hypothetical protein